jgi:type I restriction enzyme S subunit
MSKWKECTIESLGKIITGKTPRTSIVGNYGGTIPFLSPSDNMEVKYVVKTGKTLTNVGVNEVKNCLLPKNAVCVSCIGSDLGKVLITTEPTVTNQQINSIIVNSDNDTDFVYYLMKIVGKQLNYISKTSTAVPIINKTTFSTHKILVPSLDEQKKIASILSSLDDKIETNRHISATLEDLAKTIFKSWFIDFEPFKDGKFVDSELGMIPEKLIYKKIEEMPHTLETGKRPSGGVKGIESGVPSIGAENIKGLGCYDYSKTKYVTEEFASTMKKGKIKGYELLIYKDGGKPGYFIPNFAIFGDGYPFDEMCLNEHVFKLDFGNKGYSLFAYFFFKTKQIMSYLNAQGAKAAIPGINSKDIESIMMPSLENECVLNYCNKVENIITHILTLSKESARLATLRNTLLPKLMSGQITL